MVRDNLLLQLVVLPLCCLDQKRDLCRLLNDSLPMVN